MDWRVPTKHDDGKVEIPSRWLALHYYEALNILFRIENALRVLVYVVLKNELGDDWKNAAVSTDDGSSSIAAVTKKRMSQADNFGYLGLPTASPLMYLTTGELVKLILADAYWKYFAKHFAASKAVLEIKFGEINTIRNAFAHFRAISPNDVATVKQVSGHVLGNVDPFLTQLMSCSLTVPTNTAEKWYGQLKVLGTSCTRLEFKQDRDGRWTRIDLVYTVPVLSSHKGYNERFTYSVIGLDGPAVISACPSLAKNLICATEYIPWMFANTDGTLDHVSKTLSLRFSQKAVTDNVEVIRQELEKVLSTIADETELIKQDNLARGTIMRPLSLTGTKSDGTEWVLVSPIPLQSDEPPIGQPEWWGTMQIYVDDFISSTNAFPWMATTISTTQFPA